MGYLKQLPVISGDHESRYEADKVAQIQYRDSHQDSSYLLSDGGRIEGYETDEEANHKKSCALRDYLECQSAIRYDIFSR